MIDAYKRHPLLTAVLQATLPKAIVIGSTLQCLQLSGCFPETVTHFPYLSSIYALIGIAFGIPLNVATM